MKHMEEEPVESCVNYLLFLTSPCNLPTPHNLIGNNASGLPKTKNLTFKPNITYGQKKITD